MQLSTCPQEDLAAELESHLSTWDHPRGDLYNWIPVLDRFDAILEKINMESGCAVGAQMKEFDVTSRTLLIAILRATRLLIENCTNRSIYNSYDVFLLCFIRIV